MSSPVVNFDQKVCSPRHTLVMVSMHDIRVGEDSEDHSVSPEDGLLFTVTVSPNLKNTVFADFFESEQDPPYADGLTEET